VVSTTARTSYTEGGKTVTTTSQAPGDNLTGPGAVNTKVETDASGGQTVTTTMYGGKDPTVHTTTVAAPPQTSSSDGNAGPIENWEQQYDTKGSMDYVEKHGAGY
jgi:hypothetical protein